MSRGGDRVSIFGIFIAISVTVGEGYVKKFESYG